MSYGVQLTPHQHRISIVIAPDERSAQVVVEGNQFHVAGDSPKETRRAALDVAADYAARTGRPVVVDARDAHSVWELIANPSGVVRAAPAGGGRAAPPRPPRAPRRRGPGTGTGRRVALAVAGGAVAVAVLAGGGYAVVRFLPDTLETVQGEQTSAPEPATLDSRPVPPGFTEQAAWRLDMAPGTRPAVAPDGSAVAFVDPDERLVVAGPDGVERWAADLPVPLGDIDQQLRIVAAGESLRVALVGDGTLWTWPLEGGDPEAVELPAGAQVSYAGRAPLVLAGGGAFVPSGGELAPVPLSDGQGALAADGDAVLVASARGPWAWAAEDGEPAEVEPAEPDGARRLDRVLTASAEHVLIRWTSADEDRVVLAVHDAQDGSVAASVAIAPGELEDARWVAGEAVAAYGPVVVDLTAGEARALSGFTPVTAAGDTLFGELDGAEVAVARDGDPVELEPDTAQPWGLLDGRAVVVAGDGLYALSPE
ncbi:hypothetical protein [Marinitenerispora sediminis]|uniref:Uncharacterized protein n=1 Tax=Marinitenerispora sediminis TaxID=1931232 RepID=A0A368T5I8_9ACTN|nr:hypothetical protein [Marinitenerispora sediminis]RCV54659.1 hypothetical protein DEF23_15625 [Marinitenerispora sediminis]RCV56417.1 hypothetical protein DEF28_03700 [Marinitenerispora sediminis]RCV58618.1 hypothetical protein DEF24_12790 [Marinitenerispora sediminis]